VFECHIEAPRINRRAASEDPSNRCHAALTVQLERLSPTLVLGKMRPLSSLATSSESDSVEACADIDVVVECKAPGASAAASDPCSPLLELPMRSRLLLHKLTSRGFQQMQKRMEEAAEAAPSIGASVDKMRWSDEPSDSESESRSADTESTQADSDDAQCRGSKLRSKKTPLKAQVSARSSSKKHSEQFAETQVWSDSDWNAWMAASAAYASWPVYQENQWS